MTNTNQTASKETTTMLTGMWSNGEMVSNPGTAPVNSVEVHQNNKGQFEVRFLGAVLGTEANINEANTIAINVSRGLSEPTRDELMRELLDLQNDNEARDIVTISAMLGDSELAAHVARQRSH